MKNEAYPPEQIVKLPTQVGAGRAEAVEEVCRKPNIGDGAYRRRQKICRGMGGDEIRRLKGPGRVDERLKRLAAGLGPAAVFRLAQQPRRRSTCRRAT